MASTIDTILSDVPPDAFVEQALFPNVIAGPTGPTGPRGPPGNSIYPRVGPPNTTIGFNNMDIWLDVDTGEMYQFTLNGDTLMWCSVGNLMGPTGPTGPTGPSITGPRGCDGERGPSGPQGCRGPPGSDGRVANVYSFLGQNPTMQAESGDLAIGKDEKDDGTTLLSLFHYSNSGWSLAGTIQGFNTRCNPCLPPPCSPTPMTCYPPYPSYPCMPNGPRNNHPNGCRCNDCCQSDRYNSHPNGCRCNDCSDMRRPATCGWPSRCPPQHPQDCRCNDCCRSNERCEIRRINPTFNLNRNVGVGAGASTTFTMNLNINSEGIGIVTLSASGMAMIEGDEDDKHSINFQISKNSNCDQNTTQISGSLENIVAGRWIFNMTRHLHFERCGNYQLTLTIITDRKTSLTIDPISLSSDFLTITTALP
jgi:hypothetical protein